jgi:hypothetical protein
MTDENLRESMDIDNSLYDTTNGRRWRSPNEQLQHWQKNRRKLVCVYIVSIELVTSNFICFFVILTASFLEREKLHECFLRPF